MLCVCFVEEKNVLQKYEVFQDFSIIENKLLNGATVGVGVVVAGDRGRGGLGPTSRHFRATLGKGVRILAQR